MTRRRSQSSIALTVLSALSLTACATTQGAALGPLDAQGFAVLDDSAVYHVGTGLRCPSGYGDMTRTKIVEFRKDIDAGCSYNAPGSVLTAYLYQAKESLADITGGAAVAATMGEYKGRVDSSDTLTATCQSISTMQQLVSGLMGAMTTSEDGKSTTINVDPTGANADFPYQAAGLEGPGVRSFVATSRIEDGLVLKIRYSLEDVADSDVARENECKALYKITQDFAVNAGNANAVKASNDDPLMRILLAPETEPTEGLSET